MSRYYVDSSAILSQIFSEKNSIALKRFVTSRPVTSDISRVEVMRRTLLLNPELVEFAEDHLADFDFVSPSREILFVAEHFPRDISLKALDAIHVATAIAVSEQLDGIITYDKQMATAATKLGIPTYAPGA